MHVTGSDASLLTTSLSHPLYFSQNQFPLSARVTRSWKAEEKSGLSKDLCCKREVIVKETKRYWKDKKMKKTLVLKQEAH